jgi:hypothetical protein
MYGHGSQFSRKKEKTIEALLTCRTHEDAAREAGISCRTLQRWLKHPEFNEAYLMARVNSHKQVIARMQQGCPAAVNALMQLVKDPGSPASVRLRAIQLFVTYPTKTIEKDLLEARVGGLEQANREQL